MTKAQVGKFFKLARAAWRNVAPDQPFEGWRKAQMMLCVKAESVFQVSPTWGYDTLMGHMAVLACDYNACAYFATSEERRVRWVLQGMMRDVEFLQLKAGKRAPDAPPEEYVSAIYRQAGMLPKDFQDATLRDLLLVVPMLDTFIRREARATGVEFKQLPTAGSPWYFRGYKAALFRDYLDAVSASNLREAQRQKEVLSA